MGNHADTLVGKGYQVLLFNYGTGKPDQNVLSAVSGLRRQGAQKVCLIGASEGAKSSIIAAAEISPPVTGVVSLSAERRLQGADVLPFANRLTLPVLFVTAESDPYGATEATHSFYRAAPSPDKQLTSTPGSDHGTALLSGSQHADIMDKVLDFLSRHQVSMHLI